MAAAASVLAIGCAKEQVAPAGGDTCDVTFGIDIPDGITTKAISDGNTVDELLYQIFDQQGGIIEGIPMKTADISGRTATVTFQLVKDQTYQFVFWAQKKGNAYYTHPDGDLRTINVSYEGAANAEARDAFYTAISRTITGPLKETITLTRPFAQVNIGTDDADIAKAAGVVVKNSKMTLTDLPSALSTLTGEVNGEASAEFTESEVPGDELTVGGKKYTWLAMNYVLAPEDKALTAVKATLTGDNMTPIEFSVPSAPIQRNYRTNIIGSLLTNTAEFTVVVDPAWNEPDTDIDLNDIKTPEALAVLFANGGSGRLTGDVDLSATVSVPAGKEVVLDLNGKTVNNTEDLWETTLNGWSLLSVKGGSLTIKGEGTFKAKENDCYAVDVQDGGTLVIEDGTYVGNIHAVYVEEGLADIRGGRYSVQQTYPDASKAYEFVLNCYDANRKAGTAKIIVSGGEFEKFNPADCQAEGVHTNFLADGYMSVETNGVWTVVRGEKPVAMTAAELQAYITAFASAGSGDNVIEIGKDIVLKDGETWVPASVNGYQGAGVITVLGNGHTISGLNAPLFAGGFAGKSGIVVKDLTLDGVKINDSANSQGIGAFVGCIDSMPEIELDNCHLTNSEIVSTAGARVGGLIGWTSGYNNPNDGPVDTYITINKCSVENCGITANGSVGAIIGHAGANPATFHKITDCTVKDCRLNSTDDGGWRVGIVVGTANVGEVTISGTTESGNTLSQTGKTVPTDHSSLYGRFVPGTTGKLTIDGVAQK